MAGITLVQAQAQLDAYLAAETKILIGQRVVLDGQDLTRAHLEFVQAGISAWDARVKALSAQSSGLGRMRTISPLG